MQRILVLYLSRYGQTRRIAETIADTARDAGFDVDLLDITRLPEDFVPRGYKGAFIGAPVYYGRYPRCIARFARRHRVEMGRTPTAVFSVSGAAAEPDEAGQARAAEQLKLLATTLGWTPRRQAAFAGAIPYTRYNPLLRWVMRRITASAGSEATDTSRDYEFTDWEAVRAFARAFLDEELA